MIKSFRSRCSLPVTAFDLACIVVHPVEYDMGMVIRFEPPFAYLETLPVLRSRLSVQPMPLVLVQEDLKRCDAPTPLALLAKPTHIRQRSIRSDEQYTLTDGRASRHLDNFSVLPFALTLLFLHGTACLFFDHAFDVLIVRLQFGTAEIRIYPLFIIGCKFGHDVDFGLADIAYILGSPPVMSLA